MLQVLSWHSVHVDKVWRVNSKRVKKFSQNLIWNYCQIDWYCLIVYFFWDWLHVVWHFLKSKCYLTNKDLIKKKKNCFLSLAHVNLLQDNITVPFQFSLWIAEGELITGNSQESVTSSRFGNVISQGPQFADISTIKHWFLPIPANGQDGINCSTLTVWSCLANCSAVIFFFVACI